MIVIQHFISLIPDKSKILHTIHFKENGKFWRIQDYGLKLAVENATFNYENLFNGNKLLGDNMLKLMNDNWNLIADDIIPGLEETYGLVFKAIGNQLFLKVPIEDIFLK